jgi:amino acid transporter
MRRGQPGPAPTPRQPPAAAPSGQPALRAVPFDASKVKPYRSLGYRTKRLLLGPPFRTTQLVHERIPKRIALAVFSSDPISSTAYATEEMLLVLILAGTAGLRLSLPLAGGIALLLLILVISYRQVIRAYPRGGGAYMVSRDNLGGLFASICGAALLIDYVLTVAVSVSAGTAALASAITAIAPWRVELSVAFILLLMWGNLRGIREAGRVFAIPTYVYIISLGGVVVWGVWRTVTGGLPPIHYDPAQAAQLASPEGGALATVSLFLILHAFAAGTTALTGVEAIADGVPAFRRPEARNAQRTLLVMALIMAFLFLGITYLAHALQVRPFESGNPTLVAQIAKHVLGAGAGEALFVFVQVATLFILVLAANTAFNGFPVLASFAAEDALLPRQLRKRGHRLVYSNGIIVLSGAALFLVVAFHANVHRLIPLYAIGVVTSFTLAQAGMTRHHLRVQEEGWRKGLLINGLGALVTFIVLCVIVVTKFHHGAWMVVVAIPLIVFLLDRTRKAYQAEIRELKVEVSQRLAPPKPRHEVVVLLEDLDAAAIGALQYARQLNPLILRAVHITVDPDHARELAALWAKINIPVPLELVDCPDRNLLACAQLYVAELVRPDTEVTVLVPKRGYAKFWHRLLHDNSSAGLFKVLGSMDGVNVMIVPFRLGRRPLLRPVPSPPPATRPPEPPPTPTPSATHPTRARA